MPAKAGTQPIWLPACAGMTLTVCFERRFTSSLVFPVAYYFLSSQTTAASTAFCWFDDATAFFAIAAV